MYEIYYCLHKADEFVATKGVSYVTMLASHKRAESTRPRVE